MNHTFRLATVLRVRQIEQTQALGELARARQSAAVAAGAVARSDARLDSHRLPVAGPASSVVQALAARRARAADVAAARAVLAGAEQHVQDRLATWTAAAARVRGLERLAERHAEERAADDLRVEQRVLDDLAGRSAVAVPAGDVQP